MRVSLSAARKASLARNKIRASMHILMFETPKQYPCVSLDNGCGRFLINKTCCICEVIFTIATNRVDLVAFSPSRPHAITTIDNRQSYLSGRVCCHRSCCIDRMIQALITPEGSYHKGFCTLLFILNALQNKELGHPPADSCFCPATECCLSSCYPCLPLQRIDSCSQSF